MAHRPSGVRLDSGSPTLFAETHGESALDVDALLRLSRDRSAAARRELVEIIGDLFFDKDRVLNERERVAMGEILRQLIHDVEISVRKHLAIRLSDEPDAPSELVFALANDNAEIAHPILMRSDVLKDPQLIEIIRNRDLEHQLSVAMRTSVSETVADVLVETEEVTVIERLLENPGAEIGQKTMAYLVEQSQRVDAFQNPLIRRKDLPKKLAERMYWWVSGALRTEILDRHDLDASQLDDVMESAIEAAVRSDSELTPGGAAASRLVAQLVEQHGISAELMIEVLQAGEIALFEHMVEQATRLRQPLVRRLIYESGGEGLAIVCRAMGYTVAEFLILAELCRAARPQRSEEYPVTRMKPDAFYELIHPAAAGLVLDRWRRNPDYLDLLRQVEALAGNPV
ncbi:MAG: DUF2336 domain-containing protein [Rhodospirillaceae bacterium]|jgi:uncharacterized protein (DUF2336 family)|nr:DUF2336 domain-containing protein [Rhodospirillaceae bacterium]MBT3930241.1 DUF2336 domain-containing protein [Rhodospirillaceae bacterium]